VILRSTDLRGALRARQRGFFAMPGGMGVARPAGGGGGGSTDPNTLLLLHNEGTAGAAGPYIDSSMYGSTITGVGGSGILPVFSTTGAQFGSTSLLFDTGYQQYLSVPYDARFSTGAGDFCYEWWGRISSFSGGGVTPFSRRTPGSGVVCPLELKLLSAGLVQLLMSDATNTGWATTAGIYTPASITLNAPHHFVLQKTGSTIGYAQDGAWGGITVTLASMSTAAVPIIIGGGGDTTWRDYQDEFRISDVSRYTIGTPFTPPTAAFT
jgi:hypothetical protein